MANQAYDDEDEYDDEDIDIDIEGAKRRKKRKKTKKSKKGGCCGGSGMEGGASYQQMIKKIAAHNRKPGTKKYKAGVGSTKAAVKKAYNKIMGKRGGAPVTRNKDMEEAWRLITNTPPFNTHAASRYFIKVLSDWPIGDKEELIRRILDGKIKSVEQLKRYVDENAPLENIFEEPFEDEVLGKNIRCDTNKETMDICRRLSRLEREYERKFKKPVSRSAFL